MELSGPAGCRSFAAPPDRIESWILTTVIQPAPVIHDEMSIQHLVVRAAPRNVGDHGRVTYRNHRCGTIDDFGVTRPCLGGDVTSYGLVAGHVRFFHGEAFGRPDMACFYRRLERAFHSVGAAAVYLPQQVGNGPIRLAVHVDGQAATPSGAGYVYNSDEIREFGIGG